MLTHKSIISNILGANELVKDINVKDLEASVTNEIGLSVEIKNKKNNKGKVIFEYKDLDQLNKILDIIKTNY